MPFFASAFLRLVWEDNSHPSAHDGVHRHLLEDSFLLDWKMFPYWRTSPWLSLQISRFLSAFPGCLKLALARLRASSYESGYRDGSVSGMNFVFCSYGKFQPGDRDQNCWRDHSGVKCNDQAWRELVKNFSFLLPLQTSKLSCLYLHY